jgi:hypothetical protein
MQARTVTVSKLPDGYFKERLCDFVIDPEKTMVQVIAIVGMVRDFAVYIGWPRFDELKQSEQNDDMAYYCEMVHDADGVASNGDKVSEQEARALFPEYDDKVYRQ